MEIDRLEFPQRLSEKIGRLRAALAVVESLNGMLERHLDAAFLALIDQAGAARP